MPELELQIDARSIITNALHTFVHTRTHAHAALRPGPQGVRLVPRVQGHRLLQEVRPFLACDVRCCLPTRPIQPTGPTPTMSQQPNHASNPPGPAWLGTTARRRRRRSWRGSARSWNGTSRASTSGSSARSCGPSTSRTVGPWLAVFVGFGRGCWGWVVWWVWWLLMVDGLAS